MVFGFVGVRVIKTAIASIFAIITADLVGAMNPLGAGLLAILGVDVTRKRSVKTVSARFLASLVGLLLAAVLFGVIGFQLWVLALYILLAFPIIARLNFKEGIVTSSVVVFHIYGAGELTLHGIFNEVLLLMIGLGAATLVNLVYMPNEEEKLVQIRKEVDEQFSRIFIQISRTLRDSAYMWGGQEIIEADEKVNEGIAIASKALENRLLRTEEIQADEQWLVYFYMRKAQLENVQNMLQLLSQVYQSLPQCHLVADLFDQLSDDVKEPYYTGKTEQLLIKLESVFREMDLPATRQEFEVRAAVLQVNRELQQYLKIAKKDKKRLRAAL
ncbi:aromatic acid exporter family protein [Paenibacillus apiarius]|uniref:Aromatic acid exporter family protein n=1 Tax=Paenibacillus apiarius TaxID=46240 RepID=A0ABT4DTV2_9BACL|nr:aromatic acid exporter family protein [Paenibacillus apiarius]MCY9515877.1 aromatic acid exporter family protein [Paenibacillus apiarius]MCY9520787.1 aromatic acid exporter family protein [Paenibacillus apiarius]MCY9553491.1 aromatic acid exporter family protein [Paenibacillus apiarius]MCY9557985.1 aromatic acid exporter family protein [Paenibacillus apiarius]MCY9685840.1 aromatic acid exporter family protein [Paenibacillus apiarius]